MTILFNDPETIKDRMKPWLDEEWIVSHEHNDCCCLRIITHHEDGNWISIRPDKFLDIIWPPVTCILTSKVTRIRGSKESAARSLNSSPNHWTCKASFNYFLLGYGRFAGTSGCFVLLYGLNFLVFLIRSQSLTLSAWSRSCKRQPG